MAVSTYMVSEHGNHKDQKEFFLKGYNEMINRIEPETIICYKKPFPEMQGNIVFVNYDLSSWRYMNDDPYVPSRYAKYICGLEPLPENSGIVMKGGYVTKDEFVIKGMGSAFGGEWRPSPDKPDDERFEGEPGEIKETQSKGRKGGYRRKTKIGDDGRAERERHYTDHNRPDKHSDPHDHDIDWSKGYPDPGPPINDPDNVPEFKGFKERNIMIEKLFSHSGYDNFKTISEFKECINHGGEIELFINDKYYGIFPKLKQTPESDYQMLISQVCIDNPELTEKWCNTADDVLEYVIDGERLRDIITKVEVSDRTI